VEKQDGEDRPLLGRPEVHDRPAGPGLECAKESKLHVGVPSNRALHRVVPGGIGQQPSRILGQCALHTL